MGVTNFDNLPQNIVASRLQDARQLLAEQKGSFQPVSGNNIRYYRVTTTWSAFKVTPDPIIVDAVMTSDFVTTPLADLIAELETSADGVTWAGQPNYVEAGTPSYYIFDARGAVFEPRISRWGIRIMDVPANTWVRLKIQILADGAGVA